ELRDERLLLEDVFHLGGEVVGEPGKLEVQRADELERVTGPVQEVGIAERDVPPPGLDQAPYVLEHAPARHGEKATLVDGCARATGAAGEAAWGRRYSP